MDPQACLDLAWESFEEGDFESCQTHLDDLFSWIMQGGFLPVITGRKEVDVLLLKLVFQHFAECRQVSE